MVLEARSEGLPIVTFDRGALGELVAHKDTGYICPTQDLAGVREGIRYFSDRPSERSRQSANSLAAAVHPATIARLPSSSADGGRCSSARVEPHVSRDLGWVPVDAGADAAPVVDGMAAALVVDGRQRVGRWVEAGLGIGVIEPPALDGEIDDLDPPRPQTTVFCCGWPAKSFKSDDPALPLRDAAESRTRAFRGGFSSGFGSKRPGRDSNARRRVSHRRMSKRSAPMLTLAWNNRFGGLPWYWGRTGRGLAFAGGVRRAC